MGPSPAKNARSRRVSQREYARQRGVSVQAVNAQTAGRGGPIPTYGAHKQIDPAEADRLWPRPRTADFDHARTQKLVAEAARAELELAARRGELVDRAAGERIVFAFGRRHREAWLAWPARIAAELAAALGVDATVLAVHLEAHVAQQLDELSGERFDLGGASVVGGAARESAA